MMKNQKEKLRKQSHSPLQQKEQNNLTKEKKKTHIESYKTLMKINDDINR